MSSLILSMCAPSTIRKKPYGASALSRESDLAVISASVGELFEGVSFQQSEGSCAKLRVPVSSARSSVTFET